MKSLFLLLAVLLGSVSFAIMAHRYPGYVLIDVNGWTIEANLVLVGVLLVASFFLLHLVLRIGSGLAKVPTGVRYWKSRRMVEKVNQSLMLGLIKLAECKWQDAEQQLLRYAEHSTTPLLNYLAAARAAQEQDAFERRDQYLNLAHQSMPQAKVAIGLTQAQLQLAQQQREQALATLRRLQQIEPRNEKVLKTLARLYRDLGDWDNLIQLCGLLRKNRALPEDQLNPLEKTAYLHLLQQAGLRNLPVQDTWYRLPSSFQADNELLTCYVEQLIAQNSSDLAEPLIRNALKRHWNEALVFYYGRIQGADSRQQLIFAESLLPRHEKDSLLLLTLGRLCIRNALWGKARTYLEASIGETPRAEAYAELGRLLEQIGERDKAMEYYRSGLLCVPGCAKVESANITTGVRQSLETKPAPKRLLRQSQP